MWLVLLQNLHTYELVMKIAYCNSYPCKKRPANSAYLFVYRKAEGYQLLLTALISNFTLTLNGVNPGQTPFELLALLLLSLPLLFTFLKLVVLLADRNHQLLAEPDKS